MSRMVTGIICMAVGMVLATNVYATVGRRSDAHNITNAQKSLNACGFTKQIQVTGIWDKTTIRAVQSFQKKNKIDAFGYIGPATAKALNSCLPTKAIKKFTEFSAEKKLTTENQSSQGSLKNFTQIASYNRVKVAENSTERVIWSTELGDDDVGD